MSTSGPISSNQPSMPFHVARAYGVQPAAPPTRTGGASAARPSAPTGPAGKLPSPAQKLVGAQVPGRVDFSGAQPAQAGAAMPMYRHPADKNAAATAVHIGRSLDVNG